MQKISPTPGAKNLEVIGTIGAALSLIILGTSVLLRLTTEFDPNGALVSILPSSIENAARLTHRITASCVGLTAVALSFLCWRGRATIKHAFKPTAGVIVATVVLAAIGPLTPGYRYASITIANVVVGSALLMSFWWLRGISARSIAQGGNQHSLPTMTIFLFFVHIASGAAASAFHMRGIHWIAYLHIASALLFLFTAGDILWVHSKQSGATKLAYRVTGVLILQITIGLLLICLTKQPIWLAVVHALVSQIFAAGLISVTLRNNNKDTR